MKVDLKNVAFLFSNNEWLLLAFSQVQLHKLKCYHEQKNIPTKQPQTKTKTKALRCHLISKDGRKYAEGMATTSLQQLHLLYLDRRREGTVKKKSQYFSCLFESWVEDSQTLWEAFCFCLVFIWFHLFLLLQSETLACFCSLMCFGSNLLSMKHPNWWCTALMSLMKSKRQVYNTWISLWMLVSTLLLKICQLSKSFKTHLLILCHLIFSHLGKYGEWFSSVSFLCPLIRS